MEFRFERNPLGLLPTYVGFVATQTRDTRDTRDIDEDLEVSMYTPGETHNYFGDHTYDPLGFWGTYTVDTVDPGSGQVGKQCSLAVVAGKPAISYTSFTDPWSLKYARNNAADGTGAWAITTLSTDYAGRYPSLAVVNGYPAVSYFRPVYGELRWTTFYSPQEIAVEQPAGSDLPSGVPRSMEAPAGRTTSVTFTIKRQGDSCDTARRKRTTW